MVVAVHVARSVEIGTCGPLPLVLRTEAELELDGSGEPGVTLVRGRESLELVTTVATIFNSWILDIVA